MTGDPRFEVRGRRCAIFGWVPLRSHLERLAVSDRKETCAQRERRGAPDHSKNWKPRLIPNLGVCAARVYICKCWVMPRLKATGGRGGGGGGGGKGGKGGKAMPF